MTLRRLVPFLLLLALPWPVAAAGPGPCVTYYLPDGSLEVYVFYDLRDCSDKDPDAVYDEVDRRGAGYVYVLRAGHEFGPGAGFCVTVGAGTMGLAHVDPNNACDVEWEGCLDAEWGPVCDLLDLGGGLP